VSALNDTYEIAEPCFNIFAFAGANERIVDSVGFIQYSRAGTDEELVSFLQSRVDIDQWQASSVELKRHVSIEEFNLLHRLDRLYEVIPRVCEAVGDSVYCITYIIDGAPKIEGIDNRVSQDWVPDYLTTYATEAGLDLPRLFNDDFFEAAKVLWQNKKYISALKLILSAIDTLGFIEFGDVNGSFINWVKHYCDLEELGVSAEELWELRNSLLHMTNLESRKVQKGTVQSLVPVIIHPDVDYPKEIDSLNCLDVFRLMTVTLPKGVGNWLRTYNQHEEKFVSFVERYDKVVSESRLIYTYLPSSDPS